MHLMLGCGGCFLEVPLGNRSTKITKSPRRIVMDLMNISRDPFRYFQCLQTLAVLQGVCSYLLSNQHQFSRPDR